MIDLIYQINILYSRSGNLNMFRRGGGGINLCASLTVLMKTDKIC